MPKANEVVYQGVEVPSLLIEHVDVLEKVAGLLKSNEAWTGFTCILIKEQGNEKFYGLGFDIRTQWEDLLSQLGISLTGNGFDNAHVPAYLKAKRSTRTRRVALLTEVAKAIREA